MFWTKLYYTIFFVDEYRDPSGNAPSGHVFCFCVPPYPINQCVSLCLSVFVFVSDLRSLNSRRKSFRWRESQFTRNTRESHGSHWTPGVPVQPPLTHDYVISSLLVKLVFTHYNTRLIRKIKRVDYESEEFKWDDGQGDTYKGKNS